MISIRALVLLGLFAASTSCGSIPVRDESGKSFDRVTTGIPPTIILIHGMFMTPKCWDGWKDRFTHAGYSVFAPAWPLHDGTVEELREPARFDALAKLEIGMVLDRYRQFIQTQPHPVVAVGHSMGGLVAQILLAEGTVDAAVAVHPGPPHGVFEVSWASLRSNWGIISPFSSVDHPVEKDLDGFSYAFSSEEDSTEQARAYHDYYVPESRRVGRATLNDAGNVVTDKPRGPLLIFAGGRDHTIPASLNYKNFEFYENTPGYTEFVLFPERDHWTIGAPGWEAVADRSLAWIAQRFPAPKHP